jgi:hypothetical protein
MSAERATSKNKVTRLEIKECQNEDDETPAKTLLTNSVSTAVDEPHGEMERMWGAWCLDTASLFCEGGGNREAHGGPRFDARCVKHRRDETNGRIRPWAWKILEDDCKYSHQAEK